MIIRAVVVPHPPLLVPELVGGGVNETTAVREACLAAARALAEVTDDWLAVAADPAGPAVVDPAASGTFQGYGVDVRVALSEPAPAGADPRTPEQGHTGSPAHPGSATDSRRTPESAPSEPAATSPESRPGAERSIPETAAATAARPAPAGVAAAGIGHTEITELPLPVLIAGWLRDEAGARRVRVRLVPLDLPVEDCRRVGAELADESRRVGLLVLGDGSNRHGDRAPGRPDERAGAFDDAVRAALSAGDPAALLTLDPQLAGELGASGRAAWQVLAGAAEASSAGPGPSPWQARLLYSEAPFGVAYHVAVWDHPAEHATQPPTP